MCIYFIISLNSCEKYSELKENSPYTHLLVFLYKFSLEQNEKLKYIKGFQRLCFMNNCKPLVLYALVGVICKNLVKFRIDLYKNYMS